MEDLIGAGRLRSPKAVFDEIKPGDDCDTWAKSRTGLFVEGSVSVQQIVRRLMATHHDPQKPHKGVNRAVPFVTAMAKDGGAQWKSSTTSIPEVRTTATFLWHASRERTAHRLPKDDARRGWKF